jgi:hypothetical protein
VKLENEDANLHAPVLFYSVSARVNKAGRFINSFRRKRLLNIALADVSATLPNEQLDPKAKHLFYTNKCFS